MLDSSALIAAARGESAADRVEEILRGKEALIPAINLAETYDVLVRIEEDSLDEVVGRIENLISDGYLKIISIEKEHAALAADIRNQYYSRKNLPLSLADCVLLAIASLLDIGIATTDKDLASVAGACQIRVEKLPAGTRR